MLKTPLPTTVAVRPTLLAALLLVATSAGCHMAASGHNVEGVRLYQQGNHQAALQRFQQAIASDPQNADAYYNMAATFHAMGSQRNDQQSLKHAEMLYNQCLDIDKDHTDTHRGLAVLLVEMGQPERAFNLLRNWGLRNQHLAEPRVELARLYEEFGDRAAASHHLEQALLAQPDSARAWAALGRIRELEGDHSQALANYWRAWHGNELHDGVAERISALQRGQSPMISYTPPGGTRVVNEPSATIR